MLGCLFSILLHHLLGLPLVGLDCVGLGRIVVLVILVKQPLLLVGFAFLVLDTWLLLKVVFVLIFNFGALLGGLAAGLSVVCAQT